MTTLVNDVLTDLGLTGSAGPRLDGDPRPVALASPLAVADCAVASVAACLAAAADWRSPAPAGADAYRTALGDGWSGISPPGRLDGRPLSWPHLPPAYGQAPPRWS
ncbi:hypothetical protein [Micromonospora robiginosa]|uniref:Uncharacterized protein n=1 Tax=Micromonospora robiginosa TaxID=2749844 RepID=A0A7L6AYY8_9ACTN|nr:hypothetical protein [Micromonospora ferruginea]QLQ34917.1 hypothetical protein H1D33_15880 [Micromonospora ferruginea]